MYKGAAQNYPWSLVYNSSLSLFLQHKIEKKTFSDDGLVPQTSLLPSIY